MAAPPEIFDRHLLRRRLARAAPHFAAHDFLHRLSAEALLERHADLAPALPRVLCVGVQDGVLARHFGAQPSPRLVVADSVTAQLAAVGGHAVAIDEEQLPFAPQSFDCVMSNLTLQNVNDLPGALRQYRAVLAPQGAFLAAVLGGATLQELRHCLTQAELKLSHGVSPRVAPTLSAESLTTLLQRAGFAAPVIDTEKVTVAYPHLFALLHELRGMGFSNILRARQRRFTRRALFAEAAAQYAAQFPATAGGIRATFEFIYLHGWCP